MARRPRAATEASVLKWHISPWNISANKDPQTPQCQTVLQMPEEKRLKWKRIWAMRWEKMGGVIWLWHCSPGDDGVQLIGLQFRAATQRGGERCKVSLNEPMSFIKREMGRPWPAGLGKYWLSWDEWQRGPASTQAATLPREAPLRCKWEGWQEVRTDEWNRLKLYLKM